MDAIIYVALSGVCKIKGTDGNLLVDVTTDNVDGFSNIFHLKPEGKYHVYVIRLSDQVTTDEQALLIQNGKVVINNLTDEEEGFEFNLASALLGAAGGAFLARKRK